MGSIAVARITNGGVWPGKPCDPAYAIMVDGRQQMTLTTDEVDRLIIAAFVGELPAPAANINISFDEGKRIYDRGWNDACEKVGQIPEMLQKVAKLMGALR